MQEAGRLTGGSVSLLAGMQELPGRCQMAPVPLSAYLAHCLPERPGVLSLRAVLGLEQGNLFFQLVGSGGQLVHVQVLEGKGRDAQ